MQVKNCVCGALTYWRIDDFQTQHNAYLLCIWKETQGQLNLIFNVNRPEKKHADWKSSESLPAVVSVEEIGFENTAANLIISHGS